MSCMVDVSVLTESLRSLDGVDAAITHEEATLGNMRPRLRINSESALTRVDLLPTDRVGFTGAWRADEECVKVGEAAARSGGVQQGIGSINRYPSRTITA